MFHSDLVGGLASIGTGIPVIWSYHASSLPKWSLKKKTYFVIRTLGLLSSWIPKRIIVCGSSAFEAALSNGYPFKKLEKINNGIDTDYYVPGGLDFRNKQRVVVLPARWHVHKGHTVLLEAWHLLKMRSTPGRLLLMGQDMNSENQELNELILGYCLEETVFPIGEISDMRNVYQSADIVVFSSLTEATPLALCEAMSCGLVPIVTDVGDMKKMIGKSGIVCEAGNAEELSFALERILLASNSEIRKLSQLAREEIVDNYDLMMCASKYESTWLEEIST
jgi:glycosyltransferase involved in cell wall biosynthesis